MKKIMYSTMLVLPILLTSCNNKIDVSKYPLNSENQYVIPYEFMDCNINTYTQYYSQDSEQIFELSDLKDVESLVESNILINYDKRISEKGFFDNNKLLFVSFYSLGNSDSEYQYKIKIDDVVVDENKLVIKFYEHDKRVGKGLQGVLLKLPLVDTNTYSIILEIIK